MNSKDISDERQNEAGPKSSTQEDTEFQDDDESKHIKFRSKAQVEHASTRVRQSRMPRRELELQAFRNETMEEIKVFRQARKKWLQSAVVTEVGPTAVDNTLQAVMIDKRRINVMKKLGVKISMVRPHRKTIRPRMYFTFKKSLTQRDVAKAQVQTENRNIKINEKMKTSLKKDFKKMTKEAVIQMTKPKKKIFTKTEKKEKKKKKKKRSPGSLTTEEEEQMVKEIEEILDSIPFSGPQDSFVAPGGEPIPVPHDKYSITEIPEEDEIKFLGEDFSSQSREEFNRILRTLKNKPKYRAKVITEDEFKELEAVWRHYRPKGEKEEVKTEKKSFCKRFLERKFKWFKKAEWFRLRYPKSKTCPCQLVEGDNVIIIKNACDCIGKGCGGKSIEISSKTVEIDEEPVETSEPIKEETVTKSTVIRDEMDIVESEPQFNIGKAVDSKEIIRRRFPVDGHSDSPPVEVITEEETGESAPENEEPICEFEPKSEPPAKVREKPRVEHYDSTEKKTKKKKRRVRATLKVDLLGDKGRYKSGRNRVTKTVVLPLVNIFKKTP